MSTRISIIKSIIGESYKSNDEYLFFCPFCRHHKRKMSINVQKNFWKCWVCDRAGKDVAQLVKKFGDSHQIQKWNKLSDNNTAIISSNQIIEKLLFKDSETKETKIDLPEAYVFLGNKKLSRQSICALNYLKKRRIDKKDVLFWKIGYCPRGPYAGRIIIPSFSFSGDINYFIARSYEGGFLKYKNPPCSKNNIIFNHLYLNFQEPLIIVEGIFDAIVAGENSVPLLGSTLSKNSALFEKIVENKTEVYLALDADASKKESRMAELLKKYDILVRKIDTGGYKDVGEMTKHTFLERKKSAVLYDTLDSLIDRILYTI